MDINNRDEIVKSLYIEKIKCESMIIEKDEKCLNCEIFFSI